MLITGIAGVAGYNAFAYFRSLYGDQVVGMRRRDNYLLSAPGIVGINGDDQDELGRLFAKHQFRSILNCEGTCKLKSCELDPPMAQRVNVENVGNLLAMAASDCRIVHLSIDLVFSGRADGGHVEADPTDPVTVYGKTMVEAEQLIAGERPDACQLRISLPMGISFNGHAGAIDWIQARFQKSKPATLYYDEVRTPTYTDCMNELFHDILSSDLSGLFHAGGPRRLSLYQIAQIVNRVGGYSPRHLMGCYRTEAGPMPPRAGNVTLDSTELARKLGYVPFDPWPLDERFVPDHPEWHRDRSGDPGSRELLQRVLYRNPRKAAAPGTATA